MTDLATPSRGRAATGLHVPTAAAAFLASCLAAGLMAGPGVGAGAPRAAIQLGVGSIVAAGSVEAARTRGGRAAGFWSLVRRALWLLCGAYACGALDEAGVPGPWGVAGLVALLAAYPFLFGALCRRAIREEGFEGGLATLMDVAILVCSLMVASVPLLVMPLAQQHSSLSVASGITWVSDVGLLAGGAWLLYRLPRGSDVRAVAMLVASLAIFSVLSLAQAAVQLRFGPVVPWWLSAAYGPAYLMVALAPRLEAGEVTPVEREAAPVRWLSMRVALPYVALVPMLVLWFASVALHWDTRLFGSGIAVVATLVVGRQLLLLRDHHHLLLERAHQALTDELTRVRNRRAFDEDLALLLDIAERRAGGLVVLMVDLDELKSINDTDGHLAGDRALVEVAGALTAGARTSDRVYRLGGDEFAMLLPDAGASGAERVLAEARARLAEAPGAVTVSAGLACFPEDARLAEALLSVADRRLYRAKRSRATATAAAVKHHRAAAMRALLGADLPA